MGLRWSEVYGDRLVLADGKTGPRSVPLNARARHILDHQPRGGRVGPRSGPSRGLRGQAIAETLVHYYSAALAHKPAAVDRLIIQRLVLRMRGLEVHTKRSEGAVASRYRSGKLLTRHCSSSWAPADRGSIRGRLAVVESGGVDTHESPVPFDRRQVVPAARTVTGRWHACRRRE